MSNTAYMTGYKNEKYGFGGKTYMKKTVWKIKV
jgi:hypothetical protein